MDWVVTLVGIIGLPAILSTLVPFFVTRHYSKKDQNKGERENTLKRLTELENKYEKLSNEHKDNSELVKSSIESINEALDGLKNAQQALLRDRIIETYNHYYRDSKHMPIYARESLNHMYQEYKNLNGNGVIEALVEKMYLLPTEPLDSDDDK